MQVDASPVIMWVRQYQPVKLLVYNQSVVNANQCVTHYLWLQVNAMHVRLGKSMPT